MTEIEKYDYSGFGEVRFTEHDGKEWVHLGDALRMLGTATTVTAAAASVEPDETTKVVINQLDATGRNTMRHEVFVTESGLYKLALRARTPNAEPFVNWVTRKVLPSIRKTGGYGQMAIPETREQRLALAVIEAQEVVGELHARLAIAAPKAEWWEEFVSTDGLVAKDDANRALAQRGVPFGRAVQLAKSLGWVDKTGNRALKAGIAAGMVVQRSVDGWPKPYYTRKGFAYLVETLCASNGNLPAISA